MQKSEEHNASKKDYIWNPTTYRCENVEYLRSTIDNSLITCDEYCLITSTLSIDCRNKRVRYKMDCCILHTVLLVVLLLFKICYHYAKHRSEREMLTHQQYKREHNKF